MFYTDTLPFRLINIAEKSGSDQDSLFDLRDDRVRVAELRLGTERVALVEHLSNPGLPIPSDSRSYDHWFQHIAIVVRDMDSGRFELRRPRREDVSTGPQTLPEWNKNAAGIKAFYFCDPEDHVLELISFPPGKGDPKWQRPGTNIFLGIDHTAIVVSENAKSLAFYRDLLGLRMAGRKRKFRGRAGASQSGFWCTTLYHQTSRGTRSGNRIPRIRNSTGRTPTSRLRRPTIWSFGTRTLPSTTRSDASAKLRAQWSGVRVQSGWQAHYADDPRPGWARNGTRCRLRPPSPPSLHP